MSKPQAKFPTSATHGLPLQRRYVAPQAQLQLMGALDVANRRATFVASCGSVDSFGTRFVAQGLLLDRLRKNPVFLWQHNRTDPDDAIGKLIAQARYSPDGQLLALGFEAPMPRRIDGPSRMLAQVTSALTNNLMQALLAAAGAPGHVGLLALVPRLERRIGLFDTGAMPWLVQAGRRAAEAALPDILALLARSSERSGASGRATVVGARVDISGERRAEVAEDWRWVMRQPWAPHRIAGHLLARMPETLELAPEAVLPRCHAWLRAWLSEAERAA